MVLFLVLLLSVWLFLLSRKEHDRNLGIESEIQELRERALSMKEDNATLREKISYFSSDAFQEREAKEKLGYRKADERVVVLQGKTFENTSSGEKKSFQNEEVVSWPNPMKWMNLFR